MLIYLLIHSCVLFVGFVLRGFVFVVSFVSCCVLGFGVSCYVCLVFVLVLLFSVLVVFCVVSCRCVSLFRSVFSCLLVFVVSVVVVLVLCCVDLVVVVLFLESLFVVLVVSVVYVGFSVRVCVGLSSLVFWYVFSGLFMLVGVLLCVLCFCGLSFLCCVFVGFGVKFPVFPFFDWLPELHVEVSVCCSVVLAGLVLKSGFWSFVISVSCCGGFVVFLVESASFVGVCVVLCRLCVCLDVKCVIALFSVLHLSSVVCFVFHDYVFSLVFVCLVQWLHVLVSVSLFCVVGFLVDLFGVRVFCGLFGLFGLVFVVSLVVLVFCVGLEFPCSFGFFVDVVLVVCLVVWCFE